TASRLLRCLPCNSPPSLCALLSRSHQMRVAPLRNHGHNPINTQFSCLLDRPLHAVEFENCQPERHTAFSFRLDALKLMRQLEYDLWLGYLVNPAKVEAVLRHNFKLLACTGTKHPR